MHIFSLIVQLSSFRLVPWNWPWLGYIYNRNYHHKSGLFYFSFGELSVNIYRHPLQPKNQLYTFYQFKSQAKIAITLIKTMIVFSLEWLLFLMRTYSNNLFFVRLKGTALSAILFLMYPSHRHPEDVLYFFSNFWGECTSLRAAGASIV